MQFGNSAGENEPEGRNRHQRIDAGHPALGDDGLTPSTDRSPPYPKRSDRNQGPPVHPPGGLFRWIGGHPSAGAKWYDAEQRTSETPTET